jgi:hypothetical protein
LAEQLVLVCDRCGRPASETITMRARGRNLQLDLCDTHLNELTAGARAPKRGRKSAPAIVGKVPRRRGRPPGTGRKASNGSPQEAPGHERLARAEVLPACMRASPRPPV